MPVGLSGREEEVHSNQREMCKGKGAQPMGERMSILFLGQDWRVRAPRSALKELGFLQGRDMIRPVL